MSVEKNIKKFMMKRKKIGRRIIEEAIVITLWRYILIMMYKTLARSVLTILMFVFNLFQDVISIGFESHE